MADHSASHMYEQVKKSIEGLSGSSQTIQISFSSNAGSPVTWTRIPTGGTLNVDYEPKGDPAQEIFVWHVHGGGPTPIKQGSNSITIQSGDFIVYALAPTSNDTVIVKYNVT